MDVRAQMLQLFFKVSRACPKILTQGFRTNDPRTGYPARKLSLWAVFRERKLNTNLFSQTFRAPPGYPGKIPGYPAKKFDFPGFDGHTEFFGPHPFTWKTPTPPENIRTKKFRFGFRFFPEFFSFLTPGGVVGLRP